MGVEIPEAGERVVVGERSVEVLKCWGVEVLEW